MMREDRNSSGRDVIGAAVVIVCTLCAVALFAHFVTPLLPLTRVAP